MTDRALGRVTRALLLLVGVTALGLGLLVAFDPEAAGLLRIDEAIDALGSDYVVLAALGLLAVGLALLLAAARLVRGVSEATPPPVEGVLTATYPGASFDRVGGGRLRRFRSARSADDRRDRLREAAIRATMRMGGRSRTDAKRRVDEGAWTSDPVAAAYLSASGRGGLGGTSSVWEVIRGGDPVDRTVDAVLTKTTGEPLATTGEPPATTGEGSVARDAKADSNTDWSTDPDTDRASDHGSEGRPIPQEGTR